MVRVRPTCGIRDTTASFQICITLFPLNINATRAKNMHMNVADVLHNLIVPELLSAVLAKTRK